MSSHPAAPLRRACSLAAALALAACSGDTSSGPLAPTAPARSAANVALPFKGTLETMQQSVVPLGPATILSHAEGTGTATQLGRYTIVSDAIIDLQTLAGTEQVTLTAANGDMLFVTVTAQATPNADGVSLDVVENETITGGTGRFAGASGSYTVNCLANLVTGVSIGSFDGTITLDH
jgi:hypothetical protein